MDSHGGKLYLTDPVTPKGTNRTISIEQANELLNEIRLEGNITKVDNDAANQAVAGNHQKALSLYLST